MLLKINSSGPEVRRVQELLNKAGCQPKLEPTGVFDQRTEQAAKHFQARHIDASGAPLVVDGEVGDKTYWALTHRSGKDQPDAADAGETGLALRALLAAFDYHAARVSERPPGANRGGPRAGQEERFSVDAIEAPFFPNAGQPWCAMFAWQCYTRAGLSLQPDGFAAVYSWVQWAKRKGYLRSAIGFVPQPGDLFCVGPCTGFATATHIGMVEKYNGDGTITTIEGNSSDRVASRIRPVPGGRLGGELGGGGISYYIRIPGK